MSGEKLQSFTMSLKKRLHVSGHLVHCPQNVFVEHWQQEKDTKSNLGSAEKTLRTILTQTPALKPHTSTKALIVHHTAALRTLRLWITCRCALESDLSPLLLQLVAFLFLPKVFWETELPTWFRNPHKAPTESLRGFAHDIRRGLVCTPCYLSVRHTRC